ncbi:MAG TPA: hypothetical protein VNN55_02480 [bacterium]|nr:hypothetical protein [bacterium]
MTDHDKTGVDLTEERDFYEANKAEYLRLYNGKYVLIRNKTLHGTFDSFDAAYNQGIDLFGNVPMYIRKVDENDSPAMLPALFLGLLGGHVSTGSPTIQ